MKGHNTYGRHLIAHSFIFIFFAYFILLLFLFLFSYVILVFCFPGTSVFEFRFGGDALSHTYSSQFLQNPGQLFPYICTLGTMCNLSLGVWETYLYTLCSVFS
jgi:hypothetical protein